MINITLAQIETFIAVAERGGFRAAGEQLNLSQSAVSLRIRQIEDRLGLMLFSRSTRSVALTHEGKRLLSASRQTLHDLELVVSQLRDEGALNRGRVRMSALPSVAATILPPLIHGFQQRYPNIFVQVLDHVADGTIASLLGGIAEFAFTSNSRTHPDFAFEPLFRDEWLLLVPHDHPLAARKAVQIAEVVAYPLLLPMPGSTSRIEIDAAMTEAGFSPYPEREAFNIATLIAFVQNGMGVTFVPAIMTPHLDLSRCRVLPLAPNPIRRDVGILRLEGRHLSPAAAAFERHLREMSKGMNIAPASP